MNKTINPLIFLALILFYQPAVVAMKEEDGQVIVNLVDDQKQRTPLHLAVLNNEGIEAIKQILTSGVPIDAQDYQGKTALHYAAIDNFRAARLLLKHGANPKIEDNKGIKPIDLFNFTRLFPENDNQNETLLLKKALREKPNLHALKGFDWIELKNLPEFIQAGMSCAPENYNGGFTVIIGLFPMEQIHDQVNKMTESSIYFANYYAAQQKKKIRPVHLFYCCFETLLTSGRIELAKKIALWLNTTQQYQQSKVVFVGLRHGCTVANEILKNLIPYCQVGNKIKKRIPLLIFIAPPCCQHGSRTNDDTLFNSFYDQLEKNTENKPINFKKLYLLYTPNDAQTEKESIDTTTQIIAYANLAGGFIANHAFDIALYTLINKTYDIGSSSDIKALKLLTKALPRQILYTLVPSITNDLHERGTKRAKIALTMPNTGEWYYNNGLKICSTEDEKILEKLDALLIDIGISKSNEDKEKLITEFIGDFSFRGITVAGQALLNNNKIPSNEIIRLLQHLPAILQKIREQYPLNESIGSTFSIDINTSLYGQNQNHDEYLSCVLSQFNFPNLKYTNPYLRKIQKTVEEDGHDLINQKVEEENYSRFISQSRTIRYQNSSDCTLL